MCKHGETVDVLVTVDHRLSFEGLTVRKWKPIDRCIAALVKDLEDHGVFMLASCCGHGDRNGAIALATGGEIVIGPDGALVLDWLG